MDLCLMDGAIVSLRAGIAPTDSKIAGIVQKAQLRMGVPVSASPVSVSVTRPPLTATATATAAAVRAVTVGAVTAPTSSTVVETNTAAIPARLTLYCDGSCLNNGRRGAVAGYAVAAMKNRAVLHRFSERVPAQDPQTNQRAELLALRYAIQYLVESGSPGDIHTDSRYSIDCITKWAAGWSKAGWKKADKNPVLHVDIIRPLYELWKGVSGIRIHHVAAHTGGSDEHSVGNALVDEMARVAASS